MRGTILCSLPGACMVSVVDPTKLCLLGARLGSVESIIAALMECDGRKAKPCHSHKALILLYT